jgi:hypothetical protein
MKSSYEFRNEVENRIQQFAYDDATVKVINQQWRTLVRPGTDLKVFRSHALPLVQPKQIYCLLSKTEPQFQKILTSKRH